MRYHKSKLSHMNKDKKKEMPGELHYSVGYFRKVVPDDAKKQPDTVDYDLPEDMRDKKELQGEQPITMGDDESKLIAMVPNDDHPTGILSIQIHECFDLERQVIAPSLGKSETSKRSKFSHPAAGNNEDREEGDE